ncbi:SRCN1 inhibitor, partial [Dromaius novaehollandiae]|nr:SRCN1 inhibitor [Dromaius novaehollandiae]
IAPETDFSKGLDLETPTSPPVSLHHLTAVTETLGMPSFGHSPPQTQTHPSKSNNPSRAPEMVPAKTQTGPETPSKKSADKAVSVEAAERDWEEKRAALTQYSAKDINRLLEETQAELMKAIPDLEFAAKHKQATGSSSAASTPEHKPSKPQHAQKSTGKVDPNGRRGSDELTVPRYRTEKPSKSPPPPPPRRSFPSSHGLTTTRSGEVIVTSKKEPGFMKKAESEELEIQKPQVKLRRTVSEVVRPASTPPIIASAIKDDDDEDRIIAELEVFQRSSASPFIPKLRYDPLTAATSPGHADLWPNGASVAAEGWKELEPLAAPGSRAFSLPQIVLTEWVSEPPSPEAELEVSVETGSSERGDQPGSRGAGGELAPGREQSEGNSADVLSPDRPASRSDGEGKRCASPGISEEPPATLECVSASATQPQSGPFWGCDRAARETSMFPSPSKHESSQSVGEEGGHTALNSPGKQEGSSKPSHQGPLAEQSPLPCGEATDAGAGEPALPSISADGERPSTVLGVPSDVVEPRGGTRQRVREAVLPPGVPDGVFKQTRREEHTSLPAPACPVPKPRSLLGSSPDQQGSRESRAEHPKEQLPALSRPAACAAAPGRSSLGLPAQGEGAERDSGVAGKTAEGHRSLGPRGRSKGELSPLHPMTPRSKEIYEGTYQRLDSLEETIRELEITINEINSHPSVEFIFPKELLGQEESKDASEGTEEGPGDPIHSSCDDGTAQDLGQAKGDAPQSPSPSKTKPPLLPKPQLPLNSPQSGGVSIPAMKMVNPASRLKQSQQGSPDKSKHIKQRMEYMRIQGQQQVVYL